MTIIWEKLIQARDVGTHLAVQPPTMSCSAVPRFDFSLFMCKYVSGETPGITARWSRNR